MKEEPPCNSPDKKNLNDSVRVSHFFRDNYLDKFGGATLWSRVIRANYVFVLAIISGTVLRFYQIDRQMLDDDELLSLSVSSYDFKYILSHFGVADYCIPLTALNKLIAMHFSLSELVLRFPSLIFGVAGIIILPLMIQELLGNRIRDLFAWLLAISPLAIYYSRNARPYSISTYLAFCGVIAFYLWWNTGKSRWAKIYVICAITGPYFHLTVLPFLLTPLLLAAIESFFFGKKERIHDLPKVIGITATGLISLLIYPIYNDFHAITTKLNKGFMVFETLRDSFHLVVGTKETGLLLIAYAEILLGGTFLARQRPRFLLYAVFPVLSQLLTTLYGGALSFSVPLVFVRYNLLFLPLGLLLTAVGLVETAKWCRGKLSYPFINALPGLACLLLFAFGPVPKIYYSPNNWINHITFQSNYDLHFFKPFLSPLRVSDFYKKLATTSSKNRPIIEAPYHIHATINMVLLHYQKVHQRVVYAGLIRRIDSHPFQFLEPPLNDERTQLANSVDIANAEAVKKTNAQYIVFHKNIAAEVPLYAPETKESAQLELRRIKYFSREEVRIIIPQKFYAYDAALYLGYLSRHYGLPVFEDRDIVVFDVDKAMTLASTLNP